MTNKRLEAREAAETRENDGGKEELLGKKFLHQTRCEFVFIMF